MIVKYSTFARSPDFTNIQVPHPQVALADENTLEYSDEQPIGMFVELPRVAKCL